MIIFLATAGAIVGLGITGVCYSANIQHNYKKLKCSLLLFINEAISGASEEYSPESTWIGVTGACGKGEEALNHVDEEEMQGVASASTHNFDTPADYSSAETIIDKIETDFESKKVTDPFGTNTDEIELTLLTGGTIFETLRAEVKVYKQVYSNMGGLKAAANDMGNNGALNDARVALDDVAKFVDDISGFKEDISDTLDKLDTPVKIAQIAMTAYYAVIIACASITILGSMLLAFCKCNGWRCVSNLGCVILTILMVVGFLLAAVLMPVSVVLIEACDLIDIEKLANSHDLFPEDAWDALETCLINDGDLYTKKDLNEKLQFTEDAAPGLEDVQRLHDPNAGGGCEVKYETTSDLLADLERIKDEAPQEAADDVAEFDLSSIEDNCKNDKVVWHKSECGSTPWYDSTNYNDNQPICIPITLLSESCGPKISARYNSDLTCSSFATKLERLCSYSYDVKDVIEKLMKRIDRDSSGLLLDRSFLDEMDERNEQQGVCAILKETGGLSGSLDDLENALSTLSTELKDDLNCKFLADTFVRIYDSTCGSFTQGITFIGLIIGIISAITFISTAMLICVNRRFYTRKVQKRDKQLN